jgi:ABC-type nickel/cobalt efflux system permease component RcnA
MIILGLLILLGVAAVTVVALVRGGADVSIDVGSFTVNTDAAGMFIAGAVSLLLAVVGLWLLNRGMKRSRRRRREMHELRDRAARNDAASRREQPAARSETGPDHTTAAGRSTDADDHFDTTPRER